MAVIVFLPLLERVTSVNDVVFLERVLSPGERASPDPDLEGMVVVTVGTESKAGFLWSG